MSGDPEAPAQAAARFREDAEMWRVIRPSKAPRGSGLEMEIPVSSPLLCSEPWGWCEGAWHRLGVCSLGATRGHRLSTPGGA